LLSERFCASHGKENRKKKKKKSDQQCGGQGGDKSRRKEGSQVYGFGYMGWAKLL